jgi:hypothetical protein
VDYIYQVRVPVTAKKVMTEAAVVALKEKFEGIHSKEAMIKETRSWLGIAHYFGKWLSTSIRQHMQEVQEFLKKQKLEEITVQELKAAVLTFVEDLTTWWAANPRGLFGGAGPSDTTVIVTDANQLSWAAVIFRVSYPKNQPKTPQGLGELPLGLRELLVREANAFNSSPTETQQAMLVLVRFDGARWSKTIKASSSTVRERVALLEAVHRNRETLSERLVVVPDNQNVRKQWHSIEALPQALIPTWETLQSYHTNFVQHNGMD